MSHSELHDGWGLAAAAVDFLTDRAGDPGAVQNVLLYGPPGTGKSLFAQTYGLDPAARGTEGSMGTPVFRIYLTEETPAADLRGGPLPQGQEWRWVNGPAVRAWQAGARLVLDEVDKASADALTFLLAALDDRAVAGFVLPTGETVAPAAGFHVVATSNAKPDELPEALRDRFQVAIAIDEPHPLALEALSPDLRELARVTARQAPGRQISIRGWRAFDELRARHGEALAAALVFGRRAADVLDAKRIGADAEPWEPPPCYWVRDGTCRGDGRGLYADRDDDPACAGCALEGKSPAPIRTREGVIVRAA
jgi:AAA domain (dynein-related subfamily)